MSTLATSFAPSLTGQSGSGYAQLPFRSGPAATCRLADRRASGGRETGSGPSGGPDVRS